MIAWKPGWEDASCESWERWLPWQRAAGPRGVWLSESSFRSFQKWSHLSGRSLGLDYLPSLKIKKLTFFQMFFCWVGGKGQYLCFTWDELAVCLECFRFGEARCWCVRVSVQNCHLASPISRTRAADPVHRCASSVLAGLKHGRGSFWLLQPG